MKIKMLNNETINKIAAGEVIVRPVSVIKELVENAIDADSTRVSVAVEKGGKTSICVTDNGVGIAYNEVPLAFKRHATSKILKIEDLEALIPLASGARRSPVFRPFRGFGSPRKPRRRKSAAKAFLRAELSLTSVSAPMTAELRLW